MQKNGIDILTHRQPQSFTSLPDVLNQWASDNDFRLSWQTMSQNNLSYCFGEGIQPVTRKMLAESPPPAGLEEDAKNTLEALELGPMLKLFFTDDGWVVRQDAVLCYQAYNQWDATQEMYATRRRAMESGSEFVEQMREAVARDVHSTGYSRLEDPLATVNVPDVRETVNVPHHADSRIISKRE